MNTICKPKFNLGQVVGNSRCIGGTRREWTNPAILPRKTCRVEIGEKLCQEDKELNDQSLVDGSRLLSAYRTLKGERIWIITEAADDQGHRVSNNNFDPRKILIIHLT